MNNILKFLKKLGIKIYEKNDDTFKSSIDDCHIFFYKPLEIKPFHEILKSFDSHHWLHSNHWWSNTTEEDYPSNNPVIYKNGLKLVGTDFNDGRYFTYLFISNNLQNLHYRFYSNDKFPLVILKFDLKGNIEFTPYGKFLPIKMDLFKCFGGISGRFNNTSGGDPRRPKGCPRNDKYCNNYLCDLKIENCYFNRIKEKIKKGNLN